MKIKIYKRFQFVKLFLKKIKDNDFITILYNKKKINILLFYTSV